MHVQSRVTGRRASLVAVVWSIFLLLQRLPSLAMAAATGGRASPNDGSGGGQAGGDDPASSTGAERRQQQQLQQLGRRTARMRRFLTRARQMAPVMVTSSTGYNLAVTDDGDVYGAASDKSPFVQMKIVSIDAGLVALKAVETGLYVAVTDEGSVIATQSMTEDNYLIETLEPNLYTTYKWYKYHLLNWYLGINRKGRLLRYRPVRHHSNPSVATAAEERMIKPSELFLVRPIL